MRPRLGFTLVEVLVAIAIIGVLVGLLLPAVQASRESSRQALCRNNLKQIGLAQANYEVALGVYPFGVGGGSPPGAIPRWSAHSQTLPYLDQSALFHTLNFYLIPWAHDAIYGPPNRTAVSTRVATFLCPSDSDGIVDPFGLAHNNYRACAGTRPINLASDSPDGFGRNDGICWFQSAVRPAHVRDGVANTVFFSERCLGNPSHFDVKGDHYVLTGSPLSACDQADPMITPRFSSFVEWSGQRWGDGNVFYTRYQHVLTPNRPSCMFGVEDDDGPVISTASSRHPGGVNVLMGDGSVRFGSSASRSTRRSGRLKELVPARK